MENTQSLITTLIENPLLLVLLLWSLAWKGFALWRASHNESKPWFIALLLINSAGILEILYLFVFGKKKD
jgi:hypothetical protein